jgi:hypothetical protein
VPTGLGDARPGVLSSTRHDRNPLLGGGTRLLLISGYSTALRPPFATPLNTYPVVVVRPVPQGESGTQAQTSVHQDAVRRTVGIANRVTVDGSERWYPNVLCGTFESHSSVYRGRPTPPTWALAYSVRTLRWRMALGAGYYNFCRPHFALRVAIDGGRYRQRTPAMALGVTGHQWSVEEFITHPVY